MKKLFVFFLAVCFCTFSCQSDHNHSKKTPDNNEKITSNTGIVQLNCEMLSESEVSPRAALYALVRENKIKIGEIITNDCQVISTDDFAQYKIPAEAIAAAGGWWAGAGDYFYIVEAEKEYIVMKGRLEEMMEGDMEYKRVAGLQK